jgi:CRP/FNR family transcriptional regulator
MFEIIKNKSSCVNCGFISQAGKFLTEPELKQLTKGTTDVSLKKGDKLFVEGLPHSHVIYIRDGYVKVHMTGPSGRDQILKFARPGAYLGIQCLFGADANRFSATALGKVRLCFINGNTFKNLVHKNAGFASQILTYLCKDELNYFERFVSLQQKNNSGKLADAILYFSERVFASDTFNLPLSFVDLAALTGTTRESISRLFKDFVDGGIIELKNREIKIMDKAILKKISENG